MQEHVLRHFQSNYGIYSEGVAEATECWVGKTRERQIITAGEETDKSAGAAN